MKAKNNIEYRTEIINGIRYMECKCCGQMTAVSPDTTAVTCDICVRENFEKDFPFTPKTGYVSTGRPRGWAFMKQYVDKDGNVYHKGVEQPELKGTLKPTVIKPTKPKKRVTKKEKLRIRANAFAKIHLLKKELKKAKFKKDQKRINSEIKKLQKLTK
tara:strand:+ start:2260 stop:2733 length:474 start_codon:yes stop_codon:yes gene_type:complete